MQLELPSGWQEYDFLYVTVKDRYNQELFTWSYEIGTPDRLANRLLPQEGSTPAVKESIDNWYFSAAGTEVTFDKQNGQLRSVTSGGKAIPLNNGPVLISNQDIICKSVEYKQVEGNPVSYTHLTLPTNSRV